MSDTHTARRRLTQIHSELRNQGLNPIEALNELSTRLDELTSLDGPLGFVAQPADLVALVYQEILAPNARNGLGQYLTPLPVADMMAEGTSYLFKGPCAHGGSATLGGVLSMSATLPLTVGNGARTLRRTRGTGSVGCARGTKSNGGLVRRVSR